MKKKIVITSIVVIILLAIAIPFIREYRYYKEAIQSDMITSCDEYLDEYPTGRYSEEVLEKKETIAYNEVLANKSSQTCSWYADMFPDGKHIEEVRYLSVLFSDQPLAAINSYLHDFPEGKYADAVNARCDSLWDVEIMKYNSRDKQKESPAAVKFMTEMLQYMKTNRVNTIQVDVTSHINLKEYSEYNKDIRDSLEAINDNPLLSLADGMVSLKSNFSQADISYLMGILTKGVQQSLDKMFTPGFITVTESSQEDLPKLHIDYTIKSQEDKYALPEIWTYMQGSRILNYLIGISINFKTHYSIPGSATTFDYSEKGNPAGNISGIDNISEGYRRMTSMCFEQFSNKMAKNMGLKETYFQD